MGQDIILKIIELAVGLGVPIAAVLHSIAALGNSRAALMAAQAATSQISSEERRIVVQDNADIRAGLVRANAQLELANTQLSRLLHQGNEANPNVTEEVSSAIHSADKAADAAAAAT